MLNCFGREQIFCDDVVTIDNAKQVLANAVAIHTVNRADIEYLYNYYKGDQPILGREKSEHMAVCNKIVINRANEIINFKDGYLIGEPVQYISRGEGTDKSDDINKLNSYMDLADKAAEDMSLVNWMHICGTGYRLVLPQDDTDLPFRIYTLDPANTFVVYLNNVAKEPQMAVTYVTKSTGDIVYTCYLKDKSFNITHPVDAEPTEDLAEMLSEPSDIQPYSAPVIPLVEFPANNERLGEFEKVIGLLDAISALESDRLDGVEQFVQAILCFVGTELEEEQARKLLHLRMLAIPPNNNGEKIDVKYLVQELNQEQTQILIDDMYDTVLEIVGVPARSGGQSTSDTGQAVQLREGWSSTESRAKITELMFKRSDNAVLKTILNILRVNTDVSLELKDVETKFSRHNYEGLTVKSNALVAMLNNPKIAPIDAYQQSNLFIDSEAAFNRGMKWYEEQKEAAVGTQQSNTSPDQDPTGDNAAAE